MRDVCISRVIIRINPRVENAHVVLCCNDRHQIGNVNGAFVFVRNCSSSEPQVHSGYAHTGKRKGQIVVHGLLLQIHHFKHHGYSNTQAIYLQSFYGRNSVEQRTGDENPQCRVCRIGRPFCMSSKHSITQKGSRT